MQGNVSPEPCPICRTRIPPKGLRYCTRCNRPKPTSRAIAFGKGLTNAITTVRSGSGSGER